VTIALLWWYAPVALVIVAIALCALWPDAPGGNFSPSGPGLLKILVISLLIVFAIGICIGRWLS